jgi:beta-glucosidase-like glycosyl hydrolase
MEPGFIIFLRFYLDGDATIQHPAASTPPPLPPLTTTITKHKNTKNTRTHVYVYSAYIEIDGVPMVSNRLYTINLLRHELGWDGLLKPDYHELDNLWMWHMVTNTSREAARIALADTSIDQFTATPVAPADMLALVRIVCVRVCV